MHQTKLQTKLSKKYELKDGQTITKGELEEISDKEKIELRDLILILGCYYGILYKSEMKTTKINLAKAYSIREKINLIRLDLRYIEEYGERSYTKKEIENICEEYEVEVEEFLTYISRYKICYYENIEIIMRNKKGLRIGRSPELSPKFISENFLNIEQKIQKISHKIDQIYNIGIKEELAEFAINKTLTRGNIEKNLEFDTERIISKLLYKAKFDMINYVIDYIKTFKYTNSIDSIKYYEQYGEENDIQEWLYPIKFELIQRIIIEEIIQRMHETLEDRMSTLKQIYKKLGMKKIEFYEELSKIQKLFLTFNKAKICSNGRIIINEQI